MASEIPTVMKAWRLDRLGGNLSFETVTVPQVRPGTVLLKVEAAALVSYMQSYVDGKLPAYQAPNRPFTPGGNCVGTIVAVGRDVWQLKARQRVLVSSLVRSSENVPDPSQMLVGITSFGGASGDLQSDFPDGSLAEYVLLPASAVVPVEDFEDVPSTQLIAAARFVVPYGGLVRGRLAPGETVVINGATGAYGTAAILVALAMGAGRVVAAGRNHAKLDRLVALGGRAVVPVALTGDQKVDAAALRDGAGAGADIAFDMIGGAKDPSSTLAALGALRREGRLVLMGSLMLDLPIPYFQLMLNSIEIIGNFMHRPDAFRHVLALARAGRLDLSAIKPRIFPLAHLQPAMESAANADGLEQIVMQP